MAKIIKYKFLAGEVTHETDNILLDEDNEEITNRETYTEQIFLDKTLGWNETNEQIAKREAYNGEYTIEDDGQPDPADTPSQLDVIEAQVAYTAMMTDTLLEV